MTCRIELEQGHIASRTGGGVLTMVGAAVDGDVNSWVPAGRSEWHDVADLGNGLALLAVGTVQSTDGSAPMLADHLKHMLRRLALDGVTPRDLLVSAASLCEAHGSVSAEAACVVLDSRSGQVIVASTGSSCAFAALGDPPTAVRPLTARSDLPLGPATRPVTEPSQMTLCFEGAGWLVLCSAGFDTGSATDGLARHVLGATRRDPAACCHQLLGSHFVSSLPASVVVAKWQPVSAQVGD